MSEPDPKATAQPIDILHPDNPGSEGAPRPKATIQRLLRRYETRDDVARALEEFVVLMLDGTIDASELKVLLPALKTLADLLPKGGQNQTVSISERLRRKLAADPELLNELSGILPVDLVNSVLRSEAPKQS